MRTEIDPLTRGLGFVIQGRPGDGLLRPGPGGDVNGDGFDDLIIGIPEEDAGGVDSGRAYVVYGKATGFRNVDLTSLGTAGFSIRGDAAGDLAGSSISSAGDINGDGIDDIIIGAEGGDDGGFDAGEAYIVFGRSGGVGNIDLTNLGNRGFVVQGDSPDDYAGAAVSAGDINGDGFDDVLAGAPGDESGGRFAGAAYVIYGQAAGFGRVDLSSFVGTSIQGPQFYGIGGALSSAGDVNGDGFADVVLGAPSADRIGGFLNGTVFVLFGRAEGIADIDLANPLGAAGFQILGGEDYDWAGTSVSSAGDVNGDGFDDLLIGATEYSDPRYSAPGEGKAYVIFGKADGFGTIDLANLAPADGFVLNGESSFDLTGTWVATAGDVNGDGLDDIMIGAPDGTGPAKVYVVFGKASGFTSVDLGDLSPDDGFMLFNSTIGVRFSSAGDINRDGFDDLIVAGSGSEAYVIFGGEHLAPMTLIGTSRPDLLEGGVAGDHIEGSGGNDVLEGWLGDDYLNGGGGFDTANYRRSAVGVSVSLAIQGPQDTIGAGIDTLIAIDNLTGSAFRDRLEGNIGDNVLNGGAGNDQLRGDAGNDLLSGGAGSDTALYTGASAGVEVRLQITSGQNTGGAETDRLHGIENVTGSDFRDMLTGNAGTNVLTGGLGDDRLEGGDGADTLLGGDGHDGLVGGRGADVARGGLGNDTYYVDNAGDRVVEAAGEGNDVVRASIDFALAANVERLFIDSNWVGEGNSLDNFMSGGTALFGQAGDDSLSTGSGDNALYGGVGRDRLTGGRGRDAFHFDTRAAPDNVDEILDFVAADDVIMLDRAVFRAIGADGVLAVSAFRAGTEAADASDRIIYDSATGFLYYDADGTGAAAQAAFAHVRAGTSITRADFRAYSTAAAAPEAQAVAILFEDNAEHAVTAAMPPLVSQLGGGDFHIV